MTVAASNAVSLPRRIWPHDARNSQQLQQVQITAGGFQCSWPITDEILVREIGRSFAQARRAVDLDADLDLRLLIAALLCCRERARRATSVATSGALYGEVNCLSFITHDLQGTS